VEAENMKRSEVVAYVVTVALAGMALTARAFPQRLPRAVDNPGHMAQIEASSWERLRVAQCEVGIDNGLCCFIAHRP
jgi:hypothetical protein